MTQLARVSKVHKATPRYEWHLCGFGGFLTRARVCCSRNWRDVDCKRCLKLRKARRG